MEWNRVSAQAVCSLKASEQRSALPAAPLSPQLSPPGLGSCRTNQLPPPAPGRPSPLITGGLDGRFLPTWSQGSFRWWLLSAWGVTVRPQLVGLGAEGEPRACRPPRGGAWRRQASPSAGRVAHAVTRQGHRDFLAGPRKRGWCALLSGAGTG